MHDALKAESQGTANGYVNLREGVVQCLAVAHLVLDSWLWFHYWQNTCKGRLLWPSLVCFPESGYRKTDTRHMLQTYTLHMPDLY